MGPLPAMRGRHLADLARDQLQPSAVEGAAQWDRHGRVATDLRISLTDKCSLRCTYCMPAEGLPWLRKSELLTDDEIVRLARVFVALGVTSIRAGVTDLDGHLTARALESLAAELRRREHQLNRAGAKDIEDYWDTRRRQAGTPLSGVPISHAGCQGPSAWQAAIARRRSLGPPSGNRAADSNFRGTWRGWP